MKPTREDVRTMADELDMYAEDAALMAFARLFAQFASNDGLAGSHQRPSQVGDKTQ